MCKCAPWHHITKYIFKVPMENAVTSKEIRKTNSRVANIFFPQRCYSTEEHQDTEKIKSTPPSRLTPLP